MVRLHHMRNEYKHLCDSVRICGSKHFTSKKFALPKCIQANCLSVSALSSKSFHICPGHSHLYQDCIIFYEHVNIHQDLYVLQRTHIGYILHKRQKADLNEKNRAKQTIYMHICMIQWDTIVYPAILFITTHKCLCIAHIM